MPRRSPILLLLLVVLIIPAPGLSPLSPPSVLLSAQGPPEPARTLFDARLEDIRRASVAWDVRIGPRRQVVDQVCLVPDLPTFFEVLGTWDDARFFPILLEDTEYTLKFLRAFRPAKVIRYPKRAEAIADDQRWASAVSAVGRAWTSNGVEDDPNADSEAPVGDQPPKLTAPPPGLVVSHPDASMLAAAAALAAGRFQPLLRWEPERGFGDVLSNEEAEELAMDLEEQILKLLPKSKNLADDCDFLTIAGDYPFRYNAKEGTTAQAGPAAFDDLIGRDFSGRFGPIRPRWAFTGRILGDPVVSTYRAMCSLFLRPKSALLFNGYGEDGPPWADYTMRSAANRLQAELATEHRVGPEQAGVLGWHSTFDPINRAGLVLINSSGSPTEFNLPGGTAITGDVPMTVPTAVLKIHSFSAAEPLNPETLAGRWLSNGAFVYFGSMHEPYLNSFRVPTLLADLIAEGLPFGALVRISPQEIPPFGNPWRLVYLGDPLYRVRKDVGRNGRVESQDFADWPSYRQEPAPKEEADPFDRLVWSIKTAVLRASEGQPPDPDLLKVLTRIPRNGLTPNLRPLFDHLMVDSLFQADRLEDLRAWLGRFPEGERTPELRRWLETARMVDFHRALARQDWKKAVRVWGELIRSDSPKRLQSLVTTRLAPLADAQGNRTEWRVNLQAALKAVNGQPAAEVLETELERLGPATSRHR